MGIETERRRFARGYWVFAAEQVDGYRPATALPPNPIERVAAAEAYFAATGAKVVIGGRQACYRPSTDTVHMPDEARFIASEALFRTTIRPNRSSDWLQLSRPWSCVEGTPEVPRTCLAGHAASPAHNLDRSGSTSPIQLRLRHGRFTPGSRRKRRPSPTVNRCQELTFVFVKSATNGGAAPILLHRAKRTLG